MPSRTADFPSAGNLIQSKKVMTEKVLEALLSAVQEINLQLPDDGRLEPSPDAVIFGESGKLDSLMLVSLIVAVEQKIQERLGRQILLSDERTLAAVPSPFRTIAALSEHIVALLREKDRV